MPCVFNLHYCIQWPTQVRYCFMVLMTQGCGLHIVGAEFGFAWFLVMFCWFVLMAYCVTWPTGLDFYRWVVPEVPFDTPCSSMQLLQVFFILWGFANALLLGRDSKHRYVDTLVLKLEAFTWRKNWFLKPCVTWNFDQECVEQVQGSMERHDASVDDGLLLLNLCQEERNTIAARLISTVFMLNSALGTLANGLLELQKLGSSQPASLFSLHLC